MRADFSAAKYVRIFLLIDVKWKCNEPDCHPSEVESKIIELRSQQVILDEEVTSSESEASIELNFVVAKLKYSIKRKSK